MSEQYQLDSLMAIPLLYHPTAYMLTCIEKGDSNDYSY